MAYFDPKELADTIRHEFIIDDDTGRCSKILRHPSRKSKPGGLPLNFRSAVDSDSDGEDHSPCYLATADCQSTYELIQEHLRSGLLDGELSGADDEGESIESKIAETRPSTPDSELFVYKDVSVSPVAPLSTEKSITALFLEKADFVIRPDLAAYARFGATEVGRARKLLVFYPFEDSGDKEQQSFSLTIYARHETRMSDLVGLCCYEYARNQRTNDIGDVSQYQLLMAEENGEVDRDLPAVDGHHLLSELGACWSTVALVKRHPSTSSSVAPTKLIVYTVSGGRYEFFVESLDVCLKWLRDQAVQKRTNDEGPDFLSECPVLREYVLETVEQPGVSLNLDMPISSTACLEFLLLRINSSRGDFTPTQNRRALTHKDSTSSSPLERPQHFGLHRKVRSTADSTLTSPLSDFTDSLSDPIGVYSVERIHRYKPKWSASLTIRSDGLDISPTQTDRLKKRSSLFLPSSQKTVSLSWDCIGGTEIVDRSSTKRVVRIIWLADTKTGHLSEMPRAGELSEQQRSFALSSESDGSTQSDEVSRRELHSHGHWKTLQLEANVNDAWDIAEKVSAVIDAKNSEVRQIYNFSDGGTKKPSEAALEAFGAVPQRVRSVPTSPMVRKVSKITSTVASAVPSLHRLLSKHD